MAKRKAAQSEPVTLATMIAEGHADPIAITQIATLLAKDWCNQWGGWDKCDTAERIGQIWAHRPAARKMAAMLGRHFTP